MPGHAAKTRKSLSCPCGRSASQSGGCGRQGLEGHSRPREEHDKIQGHGGSRHICAMAGRSGMLKAIRICGAVTRHKTANGNRTNLERLIRFDFKFELHP